VVVVVVVLEVYLAFGDRGDLDGHSSNSTITVSMTSALLVMVVIGSNVCIPVVVVVGHLANNHLSCNLP